MIFKYENIIRKSFVLIKDEDIDSDLIHATVEDLILVPFLKRGESSVRGEILVERAQGLKANNGRKFAEWLLEHENEIPVKFRKYTLAFPGTLWGAGDYNRLMPYLYWDDDETNEWQPRVTLIHGMWDDNDRLVRLKKNKRKMNNKT